MIIGIDLGTTNSAVGVFRDGEVSLIPNAQGHVLTPSVVGINEADEMIVGLAARERQVTHPDRTVAAFKRYMGSRRATRLGRRDFQPEELSALVLRSLKADAEHYLGEAVTEAVITVPAYFNDKQRKATRRAGELAGLKVERLLNEPTAAALAYGIHNLSDESRFLVFDLGGGTFDVSILEIFDGVIEVRASAGDNHLGGEDFCDVLIDLAFAKFKGDWKIDGKYDDPALYQRLRDQAERAKRALSTAASADMEISWKDQHWTLTVTADEFETAAQALLQRLRDPVLKALRDSTLKPDALQEIVLVGGSTRMPIVRKSVTRMFGRFPNTQINPDEAIAIGAAIQAGLKARDAALREVVLTDVCPYSLGIESSEQRGRDRIHGLFAPIIERNTVIPASRSDFFFTVDDGQRSIRFKIYQGESRYVKDNILLGETDVPVPPRKAGEIPVEVRFTYDINGLLDVDISVEATGKRHNLVIHNSDEAIAPEEIEKRRAALADLKVAPRDQETNKLALARANRCYEQFLGDKRTHVGALLLQFEAALEAQDPRLIDHARKELNSALDHLEGDIFL